MTERSTHMPAAFAAIAVALSTRTGGLTMHMVDDLRTKAEELLPRGDDLRSAVLSFATMYEDHRWDRDAMGMLGRGLQRAVDAWLHPDARPAPFRRDIDG